MTDEPKYIDQSLPSFRSDKRPVTYSNSIHSFQLMVNRAVSAVVTGTKLPKRSIFDVVSCGSLLGPLQYVTFLKFTGRRTKTKIINRQLTTFLIEKDSDLTPPKEPALVKLDNPRVAEPTKAYFKALKSKNFQNLVQAAKEEMELEVQSQRSAFNAFIEGSLKNA